MCSIYQALVIKLIPGDKMTTLTKGFNAIAVGIMFMIIKTIVN